jgi:hypothetical protein
MVSTAMNPSASDVNIRGQYLQRSNKQQRTHESTTPYMLSQWLAQRTLHIALVSPYRFTQACILVLMHSQYSSSHAHTSPAQQPQIRMEFGDHACYATWNSSLAPLGLSFCFGINEFGC